MASGSEVILPIGTQKHDPAWKHCLMIRSGGRTKLKCMYCTKLFLGGGIHRIKEHLAKQKGNASRCPKVPPDVRDAMQLSLDGATVRRKRKLKLADEVRRLNPQADPSELDPGMQMIALPEDMVDPGTADVDLKEQPLPKANKASERVRRKRMRSSPPPSSVTPLTVADGGLLNKFSSVPAPTMDRDQVYMAMGKFLYEAGVPLDAVNSVFFQPMIDAIQAAGPGFEPPTYHDLRGYILKKSIEDVNATLDHYKETWSRTGCSVLADEWTMDTGKTLINFLVYCPEGTMFLKSVDASHIVTCVDTLYELLKHVVEEVDEKNVVQVITNNTEIHALAGKRLMETFPTMFWTPCASRCIDAMLEDISKLEAISEVIENAKSITGFIYNHGTVLNLMRKYTNGRDLLVPGETHSSTNFSTLKRMETLKDDLRAMVTSEEWMDCLYSKKPAGLTVTNLISSLTFWSSCAVIVHITEPLVQLLKLVDSNKRPSMGYIYVGMYQAKEAIKKQLVKKSDYMPYCDIINWRWDRQLPRPLHAAGFFLNPRLFYGIQGQVSTEISSAMLDCIERLVPEGKLQDKTQKELSLYKSATGDFGRKMAARARNTLLPAEWWSTYGGGCPNLTRLAIRILSQTCSAKGCERNCIPFEKIHNERLNYLEHQRLCDLVFIQYNLRLQQRQLYKSRHSDPISLDNDVVSDWVVEKSDLLTGIDDDTSWIVLNQPVSSQMLSGYQNDEDSESFVTGLNDEVIRGAGQGAEDDDECKEEDESCDVTSFTCN